MVINIAKEDAPLADYPTAPLRPQTTAALNGLIGLAAPQHHSVPTHPPPAMSVTVPAILLQSGYWGAKRIETLAAFANGRPISGNMFDVVLEEAGWLAYKTKEDAEQGPYVLEDKTIEWQLLAAAAAKLHDQICEVVMEHRRVNEEKEKSRKALEEQHDERQRREMLEQHRANERRERERGEDEERAKQRAEAEREVHRRLQEEREKRRMEPERDAQRRLEEEREKNRKSEEERLKALERARAPKREKESSSEKDRKLDLSWLEDPEGASRATRKQAMREADKFSTLQARRKEEERKRAWLEEERTREKRERRRQEKAENECHKRLWDEMVRKKSQESLPAPANRAPPTPTARPTTASPSSATAPKAALTPAKTTPAPTPASTNLPPQHMSAVPNAPAPRPSATNAQSKSTLVSSPASPTAPKAAPQLTLTVTPAAISELKSNPAAVLIATPASISPQAETGPSTSASSRVLTDWPRPYNSSMDPYPPARRKPPASEPSAPHLPAPRPPAQAMSTELRTAENVEDAIGIAEETLVEHLEGLQDSAVALAISHDDMRRQIVSIEQRRKAERATRDAQAAGLGLRVGKLEGTLHNLELVDQHRDSLEGERAPEKQRLRRQKISDDIDINSVVLRFIDKMAGSKVEGLERRSTTQDERAKAYGSVITQYSQRADALEAGLKEIMGTLEERGMRLPEGGTAKRQRTA